MKIVLVCPTNNYTGKGSVGVFYPMGVLMVGTHVRREHPDFDVRVFDGEIEDKAAIAEAFIGADVVGLSANTMNYPACLSFARQAKTAGVPRVVLGGPHASAVPEMILARQPDIDACIVYDGAAAFASYVSGSPENVPNLVWRRPDGSVVRNESHSPRIPPRIVDMDYDLLPMATYWRGHERAFPAMGGRFVEGFTHIGCAWRVKLGCTYCDIPYPANTYQDPDVLWRDIEVAQDQLGVSALKDYGDCFTGNAERVRAILDARPKRAQDFELAVYARSSEVTEEMADMLRDLNVRYCYVGFDSGDTGMLRNMKKGYAARANVLALERLSRRGIRINGNVILGTRGESRTSIENTTSFVREALAEPMVHQLLCSTLCVFPGAPIYEDLRAVHPEIAGSDVPDHVMMQRLWAARFCEVSFEELVAAADAINVLNRDLAVNRPACDTGASSARAQ